MTFSCIKIKRKFRMKFGMPNYSVEAAKPGDGPNEEDTENTDVIPSITIQDTSRSYALSTTTSNSDSSCILDSSNHTSSSPNVNTKPDFKSPSLPPAPPYIPSLDSMPSLPSTSLSHLDSTTTHSACFISHVFSSILWQQSSHLNQNIYLSQPGSSVDLDPSKTAKQQANITQSSISNSSSSGKISDVSGKQLGLVTRLITNRIEKFRQRHSEPSHSSNNSQVLKSPRLQQLKSQQFEQKQSQKQSQKQPQKQIQKQIQQQQVKVYDRINIKSKVKEHLYSPLQFEANVVLSSRDLLQNFQQIHDKVRRQHQTASYPRDDFKVQKINEIEKKKPLNQSNKRNSYNVANNGTDLVRCKQLYFKSTATTASTTYDDCNYAKSINTNEPDSDSKAQQDTDYEECSKDCNCNLSEDDYYEYTDQQNSNNINNDYDYAEQFENEYDDVDYEPRSTLELKKNTPVENNNENMKLSPKGTIVDDIDGYIRLTEDEIHDIISGVNAVGEHMSESPITCTSF